MKDPRLRLFLSLLPTRSVVGLARCGPVGLWGRGPGTNGSIVGVLLYVGLFHNLSLVGQVLAALLLIPFSIAICDEAERRLQKRDPGEVILDEIVAQPLVYLGLPGALWGTPWALAILALGFGLFRLFDIWKPLFIRRLQSLPGGVGVVVDDLAAAGVAWLCLQGIARLLIAQGWVS